ncbi:alpha-beta hydrolase superfamily lysophospholipase [Frondihabitans sp. PhB188]|uniref:alpha/beta hydrolase n=1 Tax=Frondihabitans sp. PhB188 TaxID=2485200 RepID=UPI000FAE5E4F|nr:lysophospholipase [Frondihabitans sp. PhB188]ROQ36517.1 alpha-beta hydrolase superfamily lysophospholipase [Frondihabitans sp. PhB188]
MPTSTTTARIEALPVAAARGTAVVFGGRGETPEVYRRLADRLAADGYRVVAFGAVEPGTVEAARAELDRTEAGPRIVVASDSGVAAAWRAVADGDLVVDGLVVAGALTASGSHDVGGDAEIAERTACPVHRGRLGIDGVLERGALASHGAADEVDAALAGRVPAPVLAFHGEVDGVSDIDAAVAVYRALPDVRAFGLEGGLHDVLNDLSHRSVAAQIVQFAERLRTPDHGLRSI